MTHQQIDLTPDTLLRRARKQFGLDDNRAAFLHLCDLQGLASDVALDRFAEFSRDSKTLPRIVHEAVLEHVIGVSTS